MGFGYQTTISEDHTVTASTAFQNNNFSDDAYRVGLEYGFQNLFFVRGGYDYAPVEQTPRVNIFGPAFGVGAHASVGGTDVTFDDAYRSAKYFNGNHVFSVKIGL